MLAKIVCNSAECTMWPLRIHNNLSIHGEYSTICAALFELQNNLWKEKAHDTQILTISRECRRLRWICSLQADIPAKIVLYSVHTL